MTTKCILLGAALLVSLAGIIHAATGVPFMVEAVVRRWKPEFVVNLGSLVSAAVFFGIPLITWWRLRTRVEIKPAKLVIVCRYAAVSSLVAQLLVFTPLMILALLPATNTSGDVRWQLMAPAGQSPQPENPSSEPPPS